MLLMILIHWCYAYNYICKSVNYVDKTLVYFINTKYIQHLDDSTCFNAVLMSILLMAMCV